MTTKQDLLGTAMTQARVAAAIISNLRGDDDAEYVSAAMRDPSRAIDFLVNALAEIRHSQDMGRSQDSDLLEARVSRLADDIRRVIGRD